MEERKKHKVMIGIEVVLLCMLVAILGTNAASSNPPSNGVSYGKNSQTTVEGALNDLYNKANYGNASEGNILSGKTALVGGSKVTGTMPTMQGSGHVDVSETVAGNHSQNGTSYLYYKIPPHTYTGDVEWLRSSYADVANRIGLTADKIVKGQSIAGINGTAETTCPTCESQGYWKVYKFQDLAATCESSKSGGCSASSWFASAKEVLKNCNSNGCEVGDGEHNTYIAAPINLDYKEILGYNIVLSCSDRTQKCIRYSKAKSGTGGADKTTSAAYPYVTDGYSGLNAISISSGTQIDFNRNVDSYAFTGSSNDSCNHFAEGFYNKYGYTNKIGIQFNLNCFTNGSHWNRIELKGASYNLSGYIIYR